MYIVGVDPGTINAGIGVLQNGNYHESLQLAFPRNASLSKRLALFAEKIKLYAQIYPEALWCLEGGFIGINMRTSFVIGMTHGIVIATIGGIDGKLITIPPTFVKKSVSGNGHATKRQIQKLVTAICKPNHKLGVDEADALAIALAGWAIVKESELKQYAK